MLDISCQEIYSSSDYIEIRDGSYKDAPVIGRFCGNGDNLPEYLYSTKNYLQIRLENYWKPQQRLPTVFFDLRRFVSNFLKSGQGFKAQYSSTNVTYKMNYKFGECNSYFSASNGTITSPSYPYYYNGQGQDVDCVYTISQPSGTFVNLTIVVFDLTYSTFDYLEIRDGSSETSPYIGKFFGADIPTSIQSTQSLMWIKWEHNIIKMTATLILIFYSGSTIQNQPHQYLEAGGVDLKYNIIQWNVVPRFAVKV